MGSTGASTLEMGAWLIPKNMPLYNMCYHAKIGHSTSTDMGISKCSPINGACLGPAPWDRGVPDPLHICPSRCESPGQIWSPLVKWYKHTYGGPPEKLMLLMSHISRSLKVIGADTDLLDNNDLLLMFYGPILYRFQDTARCSPITANFSEPTLISRPRWRVHLGIL